MTDITATAVIVNETITTCSLVNGLHVLLAFRVVESALEYQGSDRRDVCFSE